MADQPLVVVLGDSLLTEGVAVSLANCPLMSLNSIDSNAFDIWQQIDALSPNVIIFDLEIPHSPRSRVQPGDRAQQLPTFYPNYARPVSDC